jgi:hypothetical protein
MIQPFFYCFSKHIYSIIIEELQIERWGDEFTARDFSFAQPIFP